jgi:hypothetical protein
MQLRSGNTYTNVNVQTVTELQYRVFRNKCGSFIGELNDSTRQCTTVYILYKLYCYINSETDNIGSYLNLHPRLKSFINNLTNIIPRHIHDIMSCEIYDDMGITRTELTGFTTIETARMLYELRLKLHEIIDAFDDRHI